MKKFFQQLLVIATALGLQANLREKTLTPENQAAIKSEYDKKYGEGAFEKDFADFQASVARESLESVFATISEALGNAPTDAPLDLAGVVDAINSLRSTITEMGNRSQAPAPAATVVTNVVISGIHTKDFAFGINNPFFAATKRHNVIAINGAVPTSAPSVKDATVLGEDLVSFAQGLSERYASLVKSGRINSLIKNGVDFSPLAGVDMNERTFQVRQDMLISRIVALPSLKDLFPKVSNVQSGQIFTSFLASSVSQAYQQGRVFKGAGRFEPEKAVVDKVMSKMLFGDMSELETNYLNYLNSEGSDPVKWSMIEWILLQLATQINNERNERAVMGYRVAPTEGVAGHEIYASTGVVYRLLQYFYKEHKVKAFTDADLASYTASNIGDVVKAFAAEIFKKVKNPHDYTVYLNASHKPMYSAWLANKYGKNTGFVPAPDTVPEYELAIKWVPNMPADFPFIFATVKDNIFLLENVPGEEFRYTMLRELEALIAAAYWKEGAGAAYAGKPFDTFAALMASSAKDQIIFMNWPAVVLAADSASLDAEDGRIFVTSNNSAGTGDAGADVPVVISDIANAVEGVIYHIQCGGATNATTIAKSGKFSKIASDWEPNAVGKWIDVYYNATEGKFYEAARG